MNAGSLPHHLYRAEQVRLLDRLAIQQLNVTGFELMMRAGRATFRHILRHWPDLSSLTLFCGGGNNGGDGYVVAGLAQRHGLQVQLFFVSEPAGLENDAAQARDWAATAGVVFARWGAGAVIEGDVVVDALLGTGLSAAVRSPYLEAVQAINDAAVPVVAVDVPSGLSSDTGMPLGCAVKAQLTVTFIGVKQGLLTGVAPDYVGQLRFEALDVAASQLEGDVPEPASRRIDWWQLRSMLTPRSPGAHKGMFGKVLIVGGDEGMGGAAILAAEAATRCGAGLVHAATQPINVPAFLARCPEVMAKPMRSRSELEDLLNKAEVVVVGPGLGTGAWSQQMLQAVLESGKPLVLDADALNQIALFDLTEKVRTCQHVMTPHPGEAARLLNTSVQEIQADRFQSINRLYQKFGGVVLLKGAGTLILGAGTGVLGAETRVLGAETRVAVSDTEACPSIASTGNPGMATGGMGDVLSGMIGAFLAQGLEARGAVEVAVSLHGEAANVAALEQGYISLLPTDVVAALPKLLKHCDPRSQQYMHHE